MAKRLRESDTFRVGCEVRIKKGWKGAGRKGKLLEGVNCGQMWAVVKWKGEADPDCYKFAGLVPYEENVPWHAAKGLCPVCTKKFVHR